MNDIFWVCVIFTALLNSLCIQHATHITVRGSEAEVPVNTEVRVNRNPVSGILNGAVEM